MAKPDMDVIKDIPGYKVILKTVLQSQIQHLVEQLSSTTDEESMILTASLSDGSLSHLGSDFGKGFVEDHEDIKLKFQSFCLKKHYRKKKQENWHLETDLQDSIQAIHVQRSERSSRSTSGRSKSGRFKPYPMTRSKKSAMNILNSVCEPGHSRVSKELNRQISNVEPKDFNEVPYQSETFDVQVSYSLLPSCDTSTASNVITETACNASTASNGITETACNASNASNVIPEEYHNQSTSSNVITEEYHNLSTTSYHYVITEDNSKDNDDVFDTALHTETNIDSETDNENGESYPCLSVKLETIAETLKTYAEHDSNLECKDVQTLKVIPETEPEILGVGPKGNETEPEITGVELPKVRSPISTVPDVMLDVKFEPSDDNGGKEDMSQKDYDGNQTQSEQSFLSGTAVQTPARIPTETRHVTCNKCGHTFDDSNLSTVPLGNNTILKIFKCATCYGTSTIDGQFNSHSKKKIDDKQYKCGECGLSVRCKSHLKQHQAVHTGIKPFNCDTCGKSFSRKYDLTRHIEIHADIKHFTCNICGKSFLHKGSWKKHKDVHLGIKRFKCKICGKLLSSKQRLNEHLQARKSVHKTNQYDTCGMTTTAKNNLTEPTAVPSVVKRFKCDLCSEAFNLKDTMVNHMMQCHRDKGSAILIVKKT